MLLPMLLRTMMSGTSAQGETTRKELSRVAVGVSTDISKVMGIQPAKTSKAGVPLTRASVRPAKSLSCPSLWLPSAWGLGTRQP